MTYKKWSYNEAHDAYVGNFEVVPTLPAGMYKLSQDMLGNPVANRLKIKDEILHTFENGPIKSVLKEVSDFWGSADRYKRLGVQHKRGILLYGPPGCGKTGIMSRLIQDTVDANGLVFQMNDMYRFNSALPLLRQVEGARRILVIAEDIENFVRDGDESLLLEILDGSSSPGDGFLFVGTTNYLDEIPVRLKARPSRIDTLIEVAKPEPAQRLEYLKFICKGEFAQTDKVLNDWAKRSKNFSLATLKELVISVVVYQRGINEVVERLTALGDFEDDADNSEE